MHFRRLPVLLPLLSTCALALVLASGCELPDRRNNRRQETQAKDPRYLKDLSQPGPWVCTLPFEYSTEKSDRSAAIESKTLVSQADDGVAVVARLKAACTDLEAGPRRICEREIALDRFACTNAKRFIPPYVEVAESVGHWVCELPYSYSVLEKKAAEPSVSAMLLEIPQDEPSPRPSVSPGPNPPPRRRIVNDLVRKSGANASRVVVDAMTECLGLKLEDAREACAVALTAARMRCWNQSLGEGYRPKRRLERR